MESRGGWLSIEANKHLESALQLLAGDTQCGTKSAIHALCANSNRRKVKSVREDEDEDFNRRCAKPDFKAAAFRPRARARSARVNEAEIASPDKLAPTPWVAIAHRIYCCAPSPLLPPPATHPPTQRLAFTASWRLRTFCFRPELLLSSFSFLPLFLPYLIINLLQLLFFVFMSLTSSIRYLCISMNESILPD